MDIDVLIERITNEVIKKLNQTHIPKLLVIGDDTQKLTENIFDDKFQVKYSNDLDKYEDSDYVILPVSHLKNFNYNISKSEEKSNIIAKSETQYLEKSKIVNLSDKKLIHEGEIREHCRANVDKVIISKHAIITALAQDFFKKKKIQVVRGE